MRLQCWKERLLCFSGWGGEEGKGICWVANSVKQKQANIEICQKCCGEIRQTKLQESVELLFLERRHPPGPRWPVKTNIVFVIFSVNISYSNILHNLYILPKLFITLCCVALDTLLSVLCHFQQVTDVTNNSLMPVNACFSCLQCCYLYICLKIEESLHVPER